MDVETQRGTTETIGESDLTDWNSDLEERVPVFGTSVVSRGFSPCFLFPLYPYKTFDNTRSELLCNGNDDEFRKVEKETLHRTKIDEKRWGRGWIPEIKGGKEGRIRRTTPVR